MPLNTRTMAIILAAVAALMYVGIIVRIGAG